VLYKTGTTAYITIKNATYGLEDIFLYIKSSGKILYDDTRDKFAVIKIGNIMKEQIT